MKKIALALALATAVAGCTTAEKDAALGGLAGAAIGGIAGGGKGALIGTFIGAAGGVLLGAATGKGYCQYRNSQGQIYEAVCPAGF